MSDLARWARNSFSPSNSSRLLMRWLSLSTRTKMGPLSWPSESRTWAESLMAASTPTGVRSATPITSALWPDRRFAVPKTTPLSFFTSWPSGKSEARISSSVTAGPPDIVGKNYELIGRQFGDRFGLRDAFGCPDIDGVFAAAKASQPIGETQLLGFQPVEIERPDKAEQFQRGFAKTLDGVVGED